MVDTLKYATIVKTCAAGFDFDDDAEQNGLSNAAKQWILLVFRCAMSTRQNTLVADIKTLGILLSRYVAMSYS